MPTSAAVVNAPCKAYARSTRTSASPPRPAAYSAISRWYSEVTTSAFFRLSLGSLGLIGNDTDASLLARIRAGELSALGEAYDAHHVSVRAFAQRMLGDESAAEDVVQDTFVSLPRVIARFRGDSSLRTFLISVAAHQSQHHLRSAIRRRTAHDRSAVVPLPETPTPEYELQRGQLANALTRALDSLPYEQRLAVVLCEVEERTAAEAAHIVGVPEGTIRTRVFHAKRKLREVLTRRGMR